MVKKVLGICGSPHKGSSEYLLKKALAKLDESEDIEVKLVNFRENKIAPCMHCGCCEKDNTCAIKDDFIEIRELFKEADGIIIASPIHFGSISAQTKIIIDRCQSLIMEDLDIFKGKIGMSIVVGGDRNGGQELAIQQINTYYILNGMIPISGGAFGANLGACLWSESLDEIKEDIEGLKTLDMTLNKFKDFLIHFEKW